MSSRSSQLVGQNERSDFRRILSARTRRLLPTLDEPWWVTLALTRPYVTARFDPSLVRTDRTGRAGRGTTRTISTPLIDDSIEDHVLADAEIPETLPDVVREAPSCRCSASVRQLSSMRASIASAAVGLSAAMYCQISIRFLPGAACADEATCATHASASAAGCLLDIVDGLAGVGGTAAHSRPTGVPAGALPASHAGPRGSPRPTIRNRRSPRPRRASAHALPSTKC